MDDTYTHLPLHIDPATKALSLPSSFPSSSSPSTTTLTNPSNVHESLTTVNTLHTLLKTLDTPNSIPPPPAPTNLPTQKRTAQINKLRDAAAAAHRKSPPHPDSLRESIRLYTFAIDMALGRPAWEPVGLIREELAALYRDRAQTHMGLRQWVEGWKDAEASVECKRPQGEKGKVWWRGGKCLVEMGRLGEAKDWLERGIDVEGGGLEGDEGREVRRLLGEVKARL